MASWKEVIGGVAPMIATALGGSYAGLAANVIANKVLGKSSAKPKEIIKHILANQNPETMLALKHAEHDFLVQMENLSITKEQIDAADRDSARKFNIATGSVMPAFLGAMVFIGFFGILAALVGIEMQPNAETPLNIMLGVLGGLVSQIANFYFGSSKSSSDKNDIIAKLKGLL